MGKFQLAFEWRLSMTVSLPRILSPNLGCPHILSIEELNTKGFPVVIAEDSLSRETLSVLARSSICGEGTEFILDLTGKEELSDGALPATFGDVEETRFLISTTLKTIMGGKAKFFRYQAKPSLDIGPEAFRKAGGNHRGTLYNLCLWKSSTKGEIVHHALYLRPDKEELQFIHLTDLHLALRNDIYQEYLQNLAANESGGETPFNNFNENLRLFIRKANDMADKGDLDFVLILGDLIDFLQQGYCDQEGCCPNNFDVFSNIILGSGNETKRRFANPGLKVPIFTSTGNHDWRFFPYDAGVHASVFGIDKETADQLPLNWADEQEGISKKIENTYNKLIREGSPISNRTWMGTFINRILFYIQKWQVKIATPLTGAALLALLPKIPWGVGDALLNLFPNYSPITASIVALLVSPLLSIVAGLTGRIVRKHVVGNLIAIEAGWQALKDYFLTINPYFNYGFRVGSNFFLILDTGHDCLRAQYLWDDGDKKLGPLSIEDNIIGGSPDSMAFYEANEYYPYDQIQWLERLLESIKKQRNFNNIRVFIGVHAPPANLPDDRREWAEVLSRKQRYGYLLEKENKFDINYGTINHHLSDFFHLCLGRVKRDSKKQMFPVDIVLSGHAHCKFEVRLEWNRYKKRASIYFADFTSYDDGTGKPGIFQSEFDAFRPFILQTPACGPKEDFFPDPPYYRLIKIDREGKISAGHVEHISSGPNAHSN